MNRTNKEEDTSKCQRTINIQDIPKVSIQDNTKVIEYIGYLWLSNSQTPIEYHNPSEISTSMENIADDSNPFIVEGQLYSKDANKSYSIKYVDGRHIVVEYDLNRIPGDWESDEKDDLKKFIPNRLKASKIVFRQYWELRVDEFCGKDDSCEGMQVYQPAAFVFVGFEYEQKIKEVKQ